MALAAVQLIGLTHGLFCPIFELYYGVALLIILRAVVKDHTLHAYLRWPLLSFIFRRWEIMDPAALNPDYFRAPTGRYIRIEYPMPQKP